MADWATAQEAVRQAVALAVDAADYPGADGVTLIPCTVWAGTRAAGNYRQPGKPIVELQLGAVRVKGHDETRHSIVDPGGPNEAMVATYCGYRIFTVTVSIETPSQEPASAALGARASMLRTRLRRGACHAILQAAEVAVVDIIPSIDGDWIGELGRVHSKSMTDIRFGFNEHYTETPVVGGDYIVEVHGEGALERPDGEEIQVPFAVSADSVVDGELVPIVTETDEPVVVG